MAWGPVDYQCSKCTAMFADARERNDHEDECRNLTVYGADSSGNTWTVLETYDPDAALKALTVEREKHPRFIYGVHETEEPERDGVEEWLEEADG